MTPIRAGFFAAGLLIGLAGINGRALAQSQTPDQQIKRDEMDRPQLEKQLAEDRKAGRWESVKLDQQALANVNRNQRIETDTKTIQSDDRQLATDSKDRAHLEQRLAEDRKAGRWENVKQDEADLANLKNNAGSEQTRENQAEQDRAKAEGSSSPPK
jgi:hypothetical protein